MLFEKEDSYLLFCVNNFYTFLFLQTRCVTYVFFYWYAYQGESPQVYYGFDWKKNLKNEFYYICEEEKNKAYRKNKEHSILIRIQ